MKKFLALALSLLMVLSLGTVALADVVPEENMDPACEIDLTVGGVTYNGHMQPGETYLLYLDALDHNGHTYGEALDEGYLGIKPVAGVPYEGEIYQKEDWRISASWDVGGAMVKDVKWDKDATVEMRKDSMISEENGTWVLELNENYTISTPKVLKGTITLTSKKDKDVSHDFAVDEIVCNHLVTLSGYKKQADAEDDVIDAQDNTLYQCDEDNPGYLCFNDGRLLSCTLKMVKNEKAFMYNDEAMNDDLEEKYADSDARINCYAFGGTPTFQNDAQFKLQADYADQYKVYTWDGKALHPQDFKWDSVNGVYTWTTKSPTIYVISDKELVAGAETSGTAAEKTSKNPDTGARDIVGIAATLAVVSLIAAAAVNRRK